MVSGRPYDAEISPARTRRSAVSFGVVSLRITAQPSSAITATIGGVPFGPVTSANITPDASGDPAGLSEDEFIELIRTGHDPDEPGEVLQVMPWPFFRRMTDSDLKAIYAYLRSIPHAETPAPGTCTGPGQ